MKARVNDPELAELLCPTYDDYPLFAKRPPLDHGYMEAFNRDNVHLVDIKKREPLVEVTETGVRTTQNDYEFDIIVLATGFKAYTGALEAFPIIGASGQTLNEKWGTVSWMMGANRADKGARVLIYFGGANFYYDAMDQSAAAGFPELEFR